MSPLPRPHIPLAVRVQVAGRQLRERGESLDRSILYGLGLLMDDGSAGDPTLSAARKLQRLLSALFGDKKAELHHRPALINRRRKRNGDYDPPANDPGFLVYLLEDDHDIETRIRGQHGQHSDLGLARKAKRIARNRDPKRKKATIRSANRWPPRGSRKIQNRKTRP